MATDAIVQSEEARIEFDKEPGHDKLKVSETFGYIVAEPTDTEYRKRLIHYWSKYLCMTTPRRRTLAGKRFTAN